MNYVLKVCLELKIDGNFLKHKAVYFNTKTSSDDGFHFFFSLSALCK